MKLIAVCTNIPEIDAGGFEDRSTCERYPGSAWIHELHKLSKNRQDIKVVGADEAVYLLGSGVVRPGSIFVIQEERSKGGEYLMNRGANGALLTCFESPIFTHAFYDHLSDHKKRYRHQMLFEGGTHRVTFPSFDEEEILEPVLWAGKKHMSVVSSNKHYSMLGEISGSTAYREALLYNLHDKRYTFMAHFHKKGLLDVYGKGWHPNFGRELAPGGKLNMIKDYKFYLCFENVAWPGYITEKIIQCFVAGTIPIYHGAPDHKEYLPRSAYIDATDFRTPEDLELYLQSLDTPENSHHLESMIRAGQAWLKSPQGLEHSYKGFAEKVLGIIGCQT